MNKIKTSLFVSLLTAGKIVSADLNWNGALEFEKTELIDEAGDVILPPTDSQDLTPNVYKSARSYCWNSDYKSTSPVYVVSSDNLEELPDSFGVSGGDLNIFYARGRWQNPEQHCYTTPSQLAYILSKDPNYGSLATLLFANRINCGGGNFWYGKGKTCAAQEETEIKNFWGIYPRILSVPDLARANGRCVEYNTPLYDQKGGPFTAVVVCDHPMGCYTGTTASGIIAQHKQNLRNYVKLSDPVLVNGIFLAAPDLRAKSFHSNMSAEEYIQLIMNMNQVYMIALAKCDANTALSGPIGCGVFDNLQSVVCCTTAWALRYHRPATLKNFIICGDRDFYTQLQHYYQEISTRFPTSEPTAGDLLVAFPEMFRDKIPSCVSFKTSEDLPVSRSTFERPECFSSRLNPESFPEFVIQPSMRPNSGFSSMMHISSPFSFESSEEWIACSIPEGNPVPSYAKDVRPIYNPIEPKIPMGYRCLIPLNFDPRQTNSSLTSETVVYISDFAVSHGARVPEYAKRIEDGSSLKFIYVYSIPSDDPHADDEF